MLFTAEIDSESSLENDPIPSESSETATLEPLDQIFVVEYLIKSFTLLEDEFFA